MSSIPFKRLAALSLVGGFGAGCTMLLTVPEISQRTFPPPPPFTVDTPPIRSEHVKRLKEFNTPEKAVDILVIGGGATGCGVALDAATRGLSVALVEASDYASGTSSKSTKLLHGGVRYLEKAFKHLDYGWLKLVFEALRERSVAIHQAPYLCHPLPTLLPCYGSGERPFYWFGLKFYDLLAAIELGTLEFSHGLTKEKALKLMPFLRTTREGTGELDGAIVYFDGQMDDARLNVNIAMTAARYGATVANYVKAVAMKQDMQPSIFIADETKAPKPVELRLRDEVDGKEFTVFAKAVVNAAGPWTDTVSELAGKGNAHRIHGSLGVHVTLPKEFAGKDHALIIPKTKDGRVVFLVPWQGVAIAGTTDTPLQADLKHDIQPISRDVDFILDSVESYTNLKINQKDIKSVWAGVRPLAAPDAPKPFNFDDKSDIDTTQLRVSMRTAKRWFSLIDTTSGNYMTDNKTSDSSREHKVEVDANSSTVTITGGKWTTFRKMAQDVVDSALEKLPAFNVDNKWEEKKAVTENVVLVGGDVGPGINGELLQNVMVTAHVSEDVALELYNRYGSKALDLAKEFLAESVKKAKQNRDRIHPDHPILAGEVRYCAKYEQVVQISDFLSRRSRLSFQDVEAARTAVPLIADILAEEHKWGRGEKKKQVELANEHLKTFTMKSFEEWGLAHDARK